MPKSIVGLSLQLGQLLRLRYSPLLRPQFSTARLLTSVYRGFFWRKPSNHSKVPSSGRLTGKSTSRLPPAAGEAAGVSTSAAAASCAMRHAKGIVAKAAGPKFTWSVMFL